MASNSREREMRKNKLRQNMTVNRDLEERELQEAQEEGQSPVRRHLRLILVLSAMIILLVLFLVFRWMKDNSNFTEVEEAWAVEMKDTNFSKFAEVGSGIVRYSRDGAAYYDKTGEMVWNQAYEMTEPVVSVNGTRLVIGDRGGYEMYLFNETGLAGQAKTLLPITKVTIAGNGVAAAILEDAAANYIALFDPAGAKLDIEVKTVLTGDGYPMDLSLSTDGTILMTAFAYLDAGMIQNKVVFYNFSEAGKNMVQRIVGGFQHYEAALVPDVQMLGQKAAAAFADDRISFYSLKNEVSPTLVNEITLPQELQSVFYSEEYVGVMLVSETNVRVATLVIYNNQGKEVFRKETELNCRSAAITNGHVVLYNEAECEIYSMSGQLRYAGPLVGTIQRLDNLGGNWFQIGGDEMKKLTFK